MGTLEIIGIILLIAGFVLAGIEMYLPGFGLPGILGGACLILGIIFTAKTIEQGLCHKSYIINIDYISKIENYGRWTYLVKFKGKSFDALITSAMYAKIKEIYG